jgi:hypothetical protein
MPNRLSMFSRIHARMSWASLNVGAPRSVFQAETVYPPGHAEGRHAGIDMKVWSHGPYKCAVIVRIYKNPLQLSQLFFFFLRVHTASF